MVAPPTAQPQAPTGSPGCVAAVPPDGRRCGAVARWIITWPGGDQPASPACTECAKRLRALARSFETQSSTISVDPIARD